MVRRAKIIFTFIGLVLLGTTTSFSKNPPPGIGTANVPANILIMLDNSGSMGAYVQSSVQIYNPYDVVSDSATGNVYALEFSYHRIKVFNSSGAFVRTIGGGYGSGCNQWRYSYRIALHGNYLYVTDLYNRRIVVLNKSNGACVRTISLSRSYPYSIAVTNNNIFVGHYSYYRIDTYSSLASGARYQRSYYSSSIAPLGMDVNAAGTKLVSANYWRHSVTEFNISGNGSLSFSRYIGGRSYSSSNGYFRYPMDVAADQNGNYYVADYYNHRIQKFNSSGTYLGKYGGNYGRTNGPFYYPWGIGTDKNSKVFVADTSNYAVRQFSYGLAFQSTIGGRGGTRLDVAKKAIKKIVSTTELTSGANFGLMEWGSYPRMRVNVSKTGAQTIYTNVDGIRHGGGTNLYSALNSANNYFRGSSSPIISGASSCQKNYLIVISDGYWSSHSSVLRIARSMRQNSIPVNTIAVGFALGSSNRNYDQLAQAGCAFGDEPTCTKSKPLYADNEAQLISSLSDAIKQIISQNLTASTPAVMPDTTKANFVYQATFEYKANTQWKGSLKKYTMQQDGTLSKTPDWDAAVKLNNKSPNSRKLWTVGINATGYNNFVVANKDDLGQKLFPRLNKSDSDIVNLINFVRGYDSYDEDQDSSTNDTRWKLADIYNSDINIVGPPDQSTSYTNVNEDSYYRSQNNYDQFKNGNSCGGSCQIRKEIILAGSNGGILHAFDSSNGEELWGFIPPSVLKQIGGIPSNRPKSTNPIFGVDGSPIVKDIFYDGTWKTIALTGLAGGGHSYFALDITNPLAPKHLFTFENDVDEQMVRYWDSSGNESLYGYSGGIVPEKDFRKLGEAYSTPRIIRLKINNTDKWVAVFGGGYNSATNSTYGSAAFVIDLENGGDILKKIDIDDYNTSSNVVNSVPADLIVVNADTTSKANFAGAMVYVFDLEGKITKINMTDQGTLYDKTILFNSESNTTNGRYIFETPDATINKDNQLWFYFGTGDVKRIQDRANNRIYGIRDKDFPEFKPVTSVGTIRNCSTANGPCPTSTQLGWYADLPNSRKLVASPTVQGDAVYFPLYEPPSLSNQACQYGGALLDTKESSCGGTRSIKKLGTGVLSKVVLAPNNKIVIGLSGQADKNSGFKNQDNLLTGDALGNTQIKGIQVESWRQN
jgi:type IV pilus assembly protein PilY1